MSQKQTDAIRFSLEILRKQLAEVESQINSEDDLQYKPHLNVKRTEILRAIEAGEKLLNDTRG